VNDARHLAWLNVSSNKEASCEDVSVNVPQEISNARPATNSNTVKTFIPGYRYHHIINVRGWVSLVDSTMKVYDQGAVVR
jgi:hypothetical protein